MSDLIERQKALEALNGKLNAFAKDPKYVVEYLNGVRERILQLPSAEPETHDNTRETHSCVCERTETHDLISRQAAIDAIVKQPVVDETVAKLKPCPFCGGEARLLRNAKRKIYGKDEYRTGVVAYCNVCEARMFYGSEKLALEAWNRRADHRAELPHDLREILGSCGRGRSDP